MAAQNNDLLAKASLDTMTNEEHENLISILSAVTSPGSADATGILSTAPGPSTAPSRPSTPPSPSTAPGSSIDNVFYISFNPNTDQLSQKLQDKLTNITANVNLSNTFFSTKANQLTAAKSFAPEDLTGPPNYTAAVINHLNQNALWMTTASVETQTKNFRVEKSQFHQELVKNFTVGLALPQTILTQLEGFLTNVQSTINSSSDSHDNIQIFVYIMVYVNDDIAGTWRPYIRTILFDPSWALSTYIQNKSSVINVNVDFTYIQMDGMFNNDRFEGSIKTSLEASESQAAQALVAAQTLNIPI